MILRAAFLILVSAFLTHPGSSQKVKQARDTQPEQIRPTTRAGAGESTSEMKLVMDRFPYLPATKHWQFELDDLTNRDTIGAGTHKEGTLRQRSGEFYAKQSDSVQEAWVRHYVSGRIPSDDYAAAVAIDRSGNIIVTGRSVGSGTGFDYVTVKYNNSGVQHWTTRYNGPGNDHDYATAVTVDTYGNAYVTGFSFGSGTSADYATIKYDSNGVQLWVARYNGPANTDDRATAVGVDPQGNVYVTGRSRGIWTLSDYATLKYDTMGNELWVARYDGPSHFSDVATGLAIDPIGNVYVTGWSYGLAVAEYCTIKYSGSGIEQWVGRYRGPGNGDNTAAAIALDTLGGVYVTGRSSGEGTSYDYGTIKYNAFGDEQWVASYNGPGNGGDGATALLVDAMGNVIVTGSSVGSGTGSDYATIKYNSLGTQVWTARYDGPGNDLDIAAALAIDGTGTVYVTGYSARADLLTDYATVKYNASGIEQWATRFSPSEYHSQAAAGIALDLMGNVCVTGWSATGSIPANYATIKYNVSGIEQWIVHYDGPGVQNDRAAAFVVDGSGSVYVTGSGFTSDTSSLNYSISTVKYNSFGDQVWAARLSDPQGGRQDATALTVDAMGNVYVTGTTYRPSTESDYVTIKYNPDGIEQWVAFYNGSVNSQDIPAAVAADDSGYVYVTGHSYAFSSLSDYTTIKYNSAGVVQWIARYNGPYNFEDRAYALTLDAFGNVYVAGTSASQGPWGSNYDYATVKYNRAGVQQWVARYDGPGVNTDEAIAIGLDNAGNVYVTGNSVGAGSGYDYATAKYNNSGVQQWVTRYNGSGNGSEAAAALAIDMSGNVHVTGKSANADGSVDFATVKYNSSGLEQWVARFSSYQGSINVATAMAISEPNNIYVTGWSSISENSSRFSTVKYDSAGIRQWAVQYSDLLNLQNQPVGIHVTSLGEVYVAGSTSGLSSGTYTTVKYTQTPTSGSGTGVGLPSMHALHQNYPNPFNPTTSIAFDLSRRSHTALTVYDILGREIATLVDDIREAGSHRVEFQATRFSTGVYLYRLRADGFLQTRKMVLQK